MARPIPLIAPAPESAPRVFAPSRILAGLGLLLLVAILAYLTVGARGSWSFVLVLRGEKVLQMLLVGYAVAVSTVLFQTVTHNRILTPSIMGFDALFILIQTVLVFTFGSLRIALVDPRLLFAMEVAVMVGFSLLLFRWLFSGAIRSLYLMLLVGIVCGTFFRSLSDLLQRLIDPNEFVTLQDRLFASFNTVDSPLLLVSAALILLVSLLGWRHLHAFDVLSLGRETAVNLGVPYKRMVALALVIVAVLVSVSTALVGPITFFGLLVASLARQILPTSRHILLLPAAALVAALCLVGGQFVLERLFAFDAALAVVIEFLGGIVFLLLVLKGHAR